MASYKLYLPKMGESVAEATVIKWLKKPGDYIEVDEAVMEIATDKVDSDVPSPVAGKLLVQHYHENDVVQVGSLIALIETDEPEEVVVNQEVNSYDSYHAPVAEQLIVEEVQVPYVDQINQNTVTEAYMETQQSRFYSPLVKSIATSEGISESELSKIPGSGMDGRLTKDDLLDYIRNKEVLSTVAENVTITEDVRVTESTIEVIETGPTEQPAATVNEPIAKQANAAPIAAGDEIIEMDRMRRLIAEHMVMSKQVSAHVTSFVEVDVTNIVLWRERVKASFEKREGEKITYTPIFIEAVVRSLRDFPMINISVNGTQIIKKKDINIGMATALPNGNLIVPVIKKADSLNLTGLTKEVNDLANRARNNKLKPDDIQDGTFTITNVGSFGNVMGTPIINQPQVAILAIGIIRKKPAVIETLQGDMIAIRHMMFLSLSYDHRVVDGALGGMFVKRVSDYLENWDTEREI
jgi:2-oxoglutarate dehydrogenase E2 component (dihydrolipoamide succinyltransferase)